MSSLQWMAPKVLKQKKMCDFKVLVNIQLLQFIPNFNGTSLLFFLTRLAKHFFQLCFEGLSETLNLMRSVHATIKRRIVGIVRYRPSQIHPVQDLLALEQIYGGEAIWRDLKHSQRLNQYLSSIACQRPGVSTHSWPSYVYQNGHTENTTLGDILYLHFVLYIYYIILQCQLLYHICSNSTRKQNTLQHCIQNNKLKTSMESTVIIMSTIKLRRIRNNLL